MGKIDTRLTELGITLPQPQKAKIAKILGYAMTGNLLMISGQLPQWEGDIRFKGKVGQEFSLAEGQEAARLSALNVLGQAYKALDGDLDRVRRVVKVNGFVNCTPDFDEVAQVVNGASELIIDVFG
ncbi:MAG: RidA family protein, partial [Alphaproteobacteria bacterium]